MHRSTPFSFDCKACGRCCRSKQIQINPYEVVRLADFLGISTGMLLDNHLRSDAPFLLFTGEDNTCIFLTGEGCSVHPARPLVCRLYPLGQYYSGKRKDHFRCTERQPECRGERGENGTVDSFLASQQAWPYMAASRQYLRFFDFLHEKLYRQLGAHKLSALKDVGSSGVTMAEWFDVDRVNTVYCKENNLQAPATAEEKVSLHITALKERFNQKEGKTNTINLPPDTARSPGRPPHMTNGHLPARKCSSRIRCNSKCRSGLACLSSSLFRPASPAPTWTSGIQWKLKAASSSRTFPERSRRLMEADAIFQIVACFDF